MSRAGSLRVAASALPRTRVFVSSLGLDAEKARLRRIMRQRLLEVSAADASAAGEAVAEHLMAWSRWESAPAIALFSSMSDEIETAPLIRKLREAGKPVFFPRMIAGDSLEFVQVKRAAGLRPGRFGVLEPEASLLPQALPRDCLVLVPGIAFDCAGGRLGRGRGYYDRALAALGEQGGVSCWVGVGFSFQFVDSLPMSSADILMDHVVTENGFCLGGFTDE